MTVVANNLALTNVINISVSKAQAGIGAYNTSNLALFTGDTPTGTFPASQGYQIYTSPIQLALDFGTSSNTYLMGTAVFAQSPNILAGNGYLVVIPLLVSETLATAIARTSDVVQYFGVMASTIESDADLAAAATLIQTLNKIGFFVQRNTSKITTGTGSLDLLRSGGLTQSRGLFYGSATDIDALTFQAAYASKAISVNFSGSNTTMTMHLKDLAGINPDPSITQAILATAQAAGADVYINIQGVPKTFCSGLNGFYDSVYNLQWLVGALQVAGFNYLAQSSTKLPQTEDGMDGLKGAYRAVCKQAVNNQYCAPGAWNSSTTFGVQSDFVANISQVGYYIYSQPISAQLQADRAARKASLVQIAVKEAGAVHSSSVVVYVNA